jgi:hypothetical protein
MGSRAFPLCTKALVLVRVKIEPRSLNEVLFLPFALLSVSPSCSLIRISRMI